jgi:hypothetical protein
VTGGWLDRSGQRWLLSAELGTNIAGVVLILTPVFPAGIALLALGQALPWFTRCRVCGWRPRVSSVGRAKKRFLRLRWLTSLDSCSQCGDNGQATPAARAQWVQSGAQAEDHVMWLVGLAVRLGIFVAIVAAVLWTIQGRYRLGWPY